MRPIRLELTSIALVCTFSLNLTLTGANAQDAELQQRINDAIKRGAESLFQTQAADGTWSNAPWQPDGMTALAAWTLLECGVASTDPKLQSATDYLRKAALTAEKTYAISLMIMFFDKLGDPADQILIESLGVRLLQGHSDFGGWSYGCGKPGPALLRLLEDAVKQMRANPPTIEKGVKPKLQPITEAQIRALRKLPTRPLEEMQRIGVGDNSNTQFALLALWVARRHGLPVDPYLEVVRKRFQHSMCAGGGWSYQPFDEPSKQIPTAAMTCAGLLAHAVGNGARKDGMTSKELLEYPQVRDSFKLLPQYLAPKPPHGFGNDRGSMNYFLFSLERVAVIYELKTIEDIDWYVAGAKQLVNHQSKDGSWGSSSLLYAQANTCFALLFLKRANVAWDLGPILANPVRLEQRKSIPKDLLDLPSPIPKKEKP